VIKGPESDTAVKLKLATLGSPLRTDHHSGTFYYTAGPNTTVPHPKLRLTDSLKIYLKEEHELNKKNDLIAKPEKKGSLPLIAPPFPSYSKVYEDEPTADAINLPRQFWNFEVMKAFIERKYERCIFMGEHQLVI
jgi:hypothetical protein